MEKARLSEEELQAKVTALEEQNAALLVAVETGVKPIVGKFKGTRKVKGEVKTFTFSLKEGHPRGLCCKDGKVRDAEAVIAAANGKAAEGFELDKEAAQAELQHLVNIEYAYLQV